jgi:hypothetical protein
MNDDLRLIIVREENQHLRMMRPKGIWYVRMK